MMLCYWRYCYSQNQIAQAFKEPSYQVTDVSNIKPGLEALTRDCFVARVWYSVDWNRFVTEIRGRRPFLLNEGNHATACAGIAKVGFDATIHKFVYTFDPSQSGIGKAWVEYDPDFFVGMATLVRRTTPH